MQTNRRRNEGTRGRGDEGTRGRGGEGARGGGGEGGGEEGRRGRGEEGTRGRGDEGTKGRILEPALSGKESYLKLHIISGVFCFSIPVELHHGSPVLFARLCEEEALFRVFGWF